MQFRSLLWLISMTFMTVLLYGCGGAGGGGSYQPAYEARSLDLSSEQDKKNLVDEFEAKGVSKDTAEKIVDSMALLKSGFNNKELAKDELKELPALIDEQYKKSYPNDPVKPSELLDDDDRINQAAAEKVADTLSILVSRLRRLDFSIPAYKALYHAAMQKAGVQGDIIHNDIMAKLRKGEQRVNELNEDMPMVADASGNPVLLDGLQDDQWYFYGQAYAFRGHWEPTASTRQNYKGQGVEFGLLKALQNGWAFGGMLGYQKMKMDVDQLGKSDADIYRVGPFLSWSNDRWTVDSLLSYGWVNMDTSHKQWKGSPKGSEWAAHVQSTYAIPLDHWAMGLKLVPEAYVGYRVGNIDGHDMKSGNDSLKVSSSKQTGLTTRLGTGLNYTLPDLTNPTDIGVKVGLEKTFMWQDDEKSGNSQWAKTPTPETRDTAVYYGLGAHRQFGANLDKVIGLDYMGSKGDKSGSDALTLTYRQQF